MIDEKQLSKLRHNIRGWLAGTELLLLSLERPDGAAEWSQDLIGVRENLLLLSPQFPEKIIQEALLSVDTLMALSPVKDREEVQVKLKALRTQVSKLYDYHLYDDERWKAPSKQQNSQMSVATSSEVESSVPMISIWIKDPSREDKLRNLISSKRSNFVINCDGTSLHNSIGIYTDDLAVLGSIKSKQCKIIVAEEEDDLFKIAEELIKNIEAILAINMP